MVPTPTTGYLESSPISTQTPKSYCVRLENNSWVDFIFLYAPLSKYQAFIGTIWVEKKDTIEKIFLELEEKSLI